MKKISQKIFCAFCRLERTVSIKRSVDWTNGLLAFLASLVVMYSAWGRFDARVVIFFVLFLGIAEIFIRIRWRVSLPCPHCDFDPLLYKTDRGLAVKRVQHRLDFLRHSGQHLLKQNNPFLHIPIVRVNSETKKRDLQQPRYLSREV